MRPWKWILVPALALVAALVAPATTLVQMDLEQLTRAADVVARVRVLSSESRWEGGEIWTFTRVEVGETLKGGAPREIVIRLIGGEVGGLASIVEGVPRFRAGEEAYLFLEPTRPGEMTVTSWVQGTFRVVRDAEGREAVTQDTGGMLMYDGANGRFRPGGVRQMPLEEFRQRVRAARDGRPR
jgi:hypothetical protein